jgi:hypothetical protein
MQVTQVPIYQYRHQTELQQPDADDIMVKDMQAAVSADIN